MNHAVMLLRWVERVRLHGHALMHLRYGLKEVIALRSWIVINS